MKRSLRCSSGAAVREEEVAAAAGVGDGSLLTSARVNLVKNAVQISTAGQHVRLKGREELETPK